MAPSRVPKPGSVRLSSQRSRGLNPPLPKPPPPMAPARVTFTQEGPKQVDSTLAWEQVDNTLAEIPEDQVEVWEDNIHSDLQGTRWERFKEWLKR